VPDEELVADELRALSIEPIELLLRLLDSPNNLLLAGGSPVRQKQRSRSTRAPSASERRDSHVLIDD
jgi:hypothetical protein